VAVSGVRRKTKEVTYSGGDPPTAGIARPIWWHRDQGLATKIDIGFFPDEDYTGQYAQFTDDLEAIVLGSFFNSGQDFSSTYTSFRPSVNLWAAPFGADQVHSCLVRTFDPLVAPIASVMDGKAILHNEEFGDCSTVSLGGAGSVYAKVENADFIFMHESGHFLHGQGDEYPGGGNFAVGPCTNVFPTEAACQGAAPGHRADPADCVQIGTLGVWRNGKGTLETMADVHDSSNWRDDSGYCVRQRFLKCRSGSCY
jgi:hypothetical protein